MPHASTRCCCARASSSGRWRTTDCRSTCGFRSACLRKTIASSPHCVPRSGAELVAAPLLGKLVIFGVGLIGGSFALALKRSAAVGGVVGIGRGRANLDVARAQGIADRTYTIDEAWHAELADADLV